MRRVVLIVPGLLATESEPSILDPGPPALRLLAAQGRIVRLAKLPVTETPEALYLGLSPTEGQLAQGPLTVSALGADPPTGSTHFHLSLMSFSDGEGKELDLAIPPEDERRVLDLMPRLNAKDLTIVAGHGVDHGLVWERRGDMGLTPARDVKGAIRPFLPEGDGENIFRRLIDDSINLFSELELNERRVDEGLPPINMLWPWGQGLRMSVPNLALRRGERADVASTSLRLQGLTRLAGYRHLDASGLGGGLNLRLEKLLGFTKTSDPLILVIDTIAELRKSNRLEEAAWFLREFSDRLLAPLIETDDEAGLQLTMLSPGEAGLGVVWHSKNRLDSILPFDERTLEERAVPTRDLTALVAEGISGIEPG